METALNTLNPTLNTPIRAYSYNIYDEVGRLKEVGELLTKSDIATHKVESQILYSTLPAFMEKGVRQQITRTYYDEQVFELEVNGVAFAQNNLRPRVASVTYSDRESSVNSSQSSANSLQYDRATHYSYDIHGNVKSLVQEIRSGGNPITNNFITNNYLAKRLDYDYDLISGKVNYVYYQKGQADQLSHRYTYDGDNRITQVHTSTDGTNWTRDAKYEYYAHGPLAKTELGAQNVETSVYAYTLQGWMKGMNGEHFSYALGFNDTDYKGIEAPNYGGQLVGLKETPIANNSLGSTGLYNGCITTWATNTPKLGEVDVASLTNQYQYDQLSRLRSSTVVNKGNQYKTSYQYDPNGNLTYLQRFTGLKDANNAAITAQLMDNFSYNYESKGAGYLFNTNKLRSVDDAITNTALHEEDLEDQNIDNYQYDDIGNLSKDNQEDIDKIEWTVYGMIKAVYRKAGSLKPNLVFEYDASGSRVSKISIDKTGTVSKTFYIRDASGNVMSTYTNTSISSLIALQEQYLYGSSRLGVLENGSRSYEFTDHLGNVRAVVDEFKEVKAAYEYYAFGMSLAKIDNGYRYGFNGQEKETALANSITSAEYWIYDGRLGRRWNIDIKPIIGVSEYATFVNNPIFYVDILGDSVGIKKTDDGKGNITYDVTVYAAVKNSSQTTFDMEKLQNTIKTQVEESFSFGQYDWNNGNATTVNVKTSVIIREITDPKDLKDNEHLFEVVDNDVLEIEFKTKNAPLGVGAFNSQRVYLNAKYVEGMMDGTYKKTIPHELGHTLGLYHPEDKKSPLNQQMTQGQEDHNLMHQTAFDQTYNDSQSGNSVNANQMHIIYDKYVKNELNQKTNLVHWFGSRMPWLNYPY